MSVLALFLWFFHSRSKAVQEHVLVFLRPVMFKLLNPFRSAHHFNTMRSSTIVTIDEIPTLQDSYKDYPEPPKGQELRYAANASYSRLLSLWKGDITSLKIDAVVNAANASLQGGGGIDGAIHRAAGKQLLAECAKLFGCKTGDAKITSGYNLPASHVIHTVGPRGEHPLLLSSCYKRVMDIVKENDLKSVAFCCVSTGIYGYDNEKAAHVAFKTLHDWLDAHEDQVEKMDRIVLCVFLDKDENIYKRLLPQYFPKPDDATERQTAS